MESTDKQINFIHVQIEALERQRQQAYSVWGEQYLTDEIIRLKNELLYLVGRGARKQQRTTK